jgi:hypothetical protein
MNESRATPIVAGVLILALEGETSAVKSEPTECVVGTVSACAPTQEQHPALPHLHNDGEVVGPAADDLPMPFLNNSMQMHAEAARRAYEAQRSTIMVAQRDLLLFGARADDLPTSVGTARPARGLDS